MTPPDRPSVALVTGASRGIGAACARRLASDGMAVAINTFPSEQSEALARHVAEDIERSGQRALVLPADISDAASVGRMFDDCEAKLGRVDALVLNATASLRGPWSQIKESEWDRLMAVNLKGAFLCCRRAFGRTTDQPRKGSVVAVGSILSRLGAGDRLAYVTAKAGIEGFTRALARELGGSGIRVNCVLPGAIQTEAELERDPDQRRIQQTVFQRQALQRRGQAKDVAGVISFLLGPDSAFITGQSICVDGGWLLL